MKRSHFHVTVFRLFLATVSTLSVILVTSSDFRALAQDQSRYQPADCKVEVPADVKVECGNLTVPEDHAKPNGKTITLHVAILKSKRDQPASDPVVYFEGGPGGSALEGIVDWADSPLLDSRDLILFDQRGTGYSVPSLNCPEIIHISQKNTVPELIKAKINAAAACRDRLKKEGAALSFYTTAQSAADVADLRQALHLKQWNLYGISYGTRLALEVMRDYPEGVRSVVIDSVYPAHEDAWVQGPANVDRALQILFKDCAAQVACSAAYPDLENVFYKTIETLNAKPIVLQVADANHPDQSETLVNGSVLLDTIFQALYSVDTIPELPAMIYKTSKGDYDLLAKYLSDPGSSPSDVILDGSGVYYSIECSEKIAFSNHEKFKAILQQYPHLADYFKGDSDNGEVMYDICASWGAKSPVPSEDDPVTSQIPTLLLAGQYDPITPPTWAQDAAKTLSHSYYFEFPGIGHAATFSNECPQSVMLSFLATPTQSPDASCIKSMSAPIFSVAGK